MSLAEYYGFKVYHLDKEFWQSGWQMPNKPDWENRIQNIIKQDDWVVEGNYLSSLRERTQRATVIVLLETCTLRCLVRYFRRCLYDHRAPGVDIPLGCRDKMRFHAVRNILRYPYVVRPIVMGIVDGHPGLILAPNRERAHVMLVERGHLPEIAVPTDL